MTADDIDDFVRVDAATRVRCAMEYRRAINVPVRMCAACGLRDIDDKYEPRALDDVADDHWLVVPPESVAAILGAPPVVLRGADGPVEVPLVSFFNLYNHDQIDMDPVTKVNTRRDKYLHIIEEGVYVCRVQEPPTADRPAELAGKTCIDVCTRCRRAWERPREPFVARPEVGLLPWDELYASSAPIRSVAGGADFGRLDAFSTRGLALPSALETTVLAECRVHGLVVKVTQRPGARRLTSHTLCFEHDAYATDKTGGRRAALTEDLIRSGLGCLSVKLVGPSALMYKSVEL